MNITHTSHHNVITMSSQSSRMKSKKCLYKMTFLFSRGGDQCQAGRGHPGGAGLVPGPAGESPDTQERLRHGRQQVQADVEQGAECVQREQQVRQPDSGPHHQHLLWWVALRLYWEILQTK